MNIVVAMDLWFPGHLCPWGRDQNWTGYYAQPDRLRYVVWVDPGRLNDELAPRQALHVSVTP